MRQGLIRGAGVVILVAAALLWAQEVDYLNGVPYAWPSANDGPDKILTNDGAGALSWANPPSPEGLWTGSIVLSTVACPGGWSWVSGTNGRALRGAAAYGATGGSDTHTHDGSGTSGSSTPTASGTSATETLTITGSTESASPVHNHVTYNEQIAAGGTPPTMGARISVQTLPATTTHLHAQDTLAGGAHSHGVGSLALGSHSHTAGTLALASASSLAAYYGLIVCQREEPSPWVADFDADDLAAVGDGNGVASWAADGTLGLVVTQGTAAQRPLWDADGGPNGHAAVVFDGDGDNSLSATVSYVGSLFPGGKGYFAAVVRPDASWPAGGVKYIFRNSGTFNGNCAELQITVGPTYYGWFETATTGGVVAAAYKTTTDFRNAWILVQGRIDASKVYVDVRNTGVWGSAALPGTPQDQSTAWYIGGTSGAFYGSIARLVILGDVTSSAFSAEVAALEAEYDIP